VLVRFNARRDREEEASPEWLSALIISEFGQTVQILVVQCTC
jgi:hypothetical protein